MWLRNLFDLINLDAESLFPDFGTLLFFQDCLYPEAISKTFHPLYFLPENRETGKSGATILSHSSTDALSKTARRGGGDRFGDQQWANQRRV